jgi:hypothetical protein
MLDADEYFVKQKNAIKKHTTDIIIDDHTVHLKFLNKRIDVKAGKIIKLEINNVPIILIPKTTITAVTIDKPIFYSLVLIPMAFAKDSSNVTAKIRF